MKLKLTLATVSALAITALVAATLAQEPRNADPIGGPPAQEPAKSTDRGVRNLPPTDLAPSADNVLSNDFNQTRVGETRFVPDGSSYRTIYGNNFAFFGAAGDPELQKTSAAEAILGSRVSELIQRLARASSQESQEITKQLPELLAKQFDLRQKRHQMEIAALETKVKKLKDLVNKRQESRDDIIRRRLEQLVRESQGLDW
jgi:hypothetical protein